MAAPKNAPKVDVELEHDYDGIREFDNPAPGWLMLLLYSTIVFAVLYVLYYGFNRGPSMQSAYLQESAELEKQWQDYYAKHPLVPPGAGELAAAAKDPAQVEVGKKQFQTSCSPCHGANAQGLIGPNLTDNRWLHGGKMTEIYLTVVKGVPGKGMPPWGRALSPDKLKATVAYVRTLQGTNPPGAKAPEGTGVEPDPL
jgi:cytochrome c oxidase cbb3-type subunit III